MTAWELQDTLLKRQTDKIPGLNMMIPTAMHCQKIFANCFKHPVVHNSNSYNFWIISFMRTKSLFTSKLMTNFWAAKDGISVLLITKPRPHKCLAACCPACLLWKHILVQNSFQRISTPTTPAETVEEFSSKSILNFYQTFESGPFEWISFWKFGQKPFTELKVHSRTTDGRRENHFHWTAENPLLLPNF